MGRQNLSGAPPGQAQVVDLPQSFIRAARAGFAPVIPRRSRNRAGAPPRPVHVSHPPRSF